MSSSYTFRLIDLKKTGPPNRLGGRLWSMENTVGTKNDFLWSNTHDEAFPKIKTPLTAIPFLSFFSVDKPTQLSNEASRQGLAFILQQKKNDEWTLNQVGSRFISDAESSYAIIELEMLAVTWTVHKCKIFLSGLQHFCIMTDHNPLVPIMNS